MKKPVLKNAKVPYTWVFGSQYGARSYIVPFAMYQRVTLTCSAGNDMTLDMIKYTLHVRNNSFANDLPICRVQFRCVPCPHNLFSLAHGEVASFSGRWSVVGGRWSVVGGRWSVVADL